jgi:hypothetical protein
MRREVATGENIAEEFVVAKVANKIATRIQPRAATQNEFRERHTDTPHLGEKDVGPTREMSTRRAQARAGQPRPT